MLSSFSTWSVAVLLAVVPAVAFLDYGGVLPWTRWAVAVACLVIGLFALPLFFTRKPWSIAALAWPIALGVISLFLTFQTVSLPEPVVGWLSPASTTAYDLVTPNLEHHPISVAPWLTRLSVIVPAILGFTALIATLCFLDQRTVVTWMILVMVSGAVLAVLGVGEKIRMGDDGLWPATQNIDAVPFGPYVNRNNAACQLNLCLAGAIGITVLIARRNISRRGYHSAVLTRRDRHKTTFFHDAWYALLRADGTTVLAATIAVLIAAAIVATGSRAGLLGTASGLVAVIVGLSERGRRLSATVFVGVLLAAVTGLVLGIGLPGTASERLGSIFDVLDDARWGNWRDAVVAGVHHLPMGSGGGAYQFAYLPFQQTSGSAWFVNADCLPLEWFVELGLMGILIPAGAAILLLQQSLWLRRYSSKSIDRAAAAVGLFVVASQAVSQSFDFGLLQLPAVITLGASAGLVFARCSVVQQRVRQDEAIKAAQSKTRNARSIAISDRYVGNDYAEVQSRLGWSLAGIACLLCLAGPLFWSTVGWHCEAKSDFLVRAVAAWDRDQPPAPDVLRVAVESAEKLVESAPQSSDAAQLLADLYILQFRAEALANIQFPPEVNREQAWLSTSPTNLRARLFTASDRADFRNLLFRNQSETLLRQATELAEIALRVNPLNASPRFLLTKLDFLQGRADGTSVMIDQIASLQRNSPAALAVAARLAVWNPGPEKATELYRQAFQVDAELLNKEWATVSLLPQDRIVTLAASAGIFPLLDLADRYRDQPTLLDALLVQAESMISSESMKRDSDPYRWLVVRGRLAALRENWQEAVENLEQAVAAKPNEIEARLRLVRHLRSLGRLQEAWQHLAVLRSLAPSNSQIRQLSKQLESELAAAAR